MSKALIANFENLYAKAAAKNKIVAKHKLEKLDSGKSDKEIKKTLVNLGADIAADLKKAGVKPDDVDDEVADLMKMLSEIKVEPDFLDCKPPLEPGDIDFDKIAGLQDVKTQLNVNYIQPFIYPLLFPAIAKGILFYGPPGTGKTLLARAATAEIAGAAFFAPSPGELKGKYEGETEKNIEAVFKCAENLLETPGSAYKFAIIFFDEFDSLGGQRGDDPGMTRSVNALLQAMDGIKNRKNVSVVAATNYPWSLDDAILRRFTTRIFVDLPDTDAREYLIRKVLAQAYSPPNMSEDQRIASTRTPKNKYILEAPYMDNIMKYGGYEGTAAGWIGTKTTDKYITNQFISSLVKRFGPTDSGEKIIAEMKAGKNVDANDSRLDSPVHIFGYSPSDITKIMEMAVKYASTRALQGKATKKSIKEWGGIYFVVEENGDQAVLGLKGTDAARVLNFDIRESDVEQALKSLTSTVDNSRYLELLKYARQG